MIIWMSKMSPVDKTVNDAMIWMNSKVNQQSKQDLTLEPVVKVAEIQAKIRELFSACNPVVSKPKPKVELPKDKEEGQNGPVNGQEGGEAQPTSPDKPAADAETAEKQLPEMDID